MGNVGGNRNFGFGKQMAWAGAQALRDSYGDGHYATVAAHSERWGQFAHWAKTMEGIRDALIEIEHHGDLVRRRFARSFSFTLPHKPAPLAPILV